jgi:hypothetical protein
MPRNGISSEALGDPRASVLFAAIRPDPHDPRHGGLVEGLRSSWEMIRGSDDDEASQHMRYLARYIASCALDPGVAVTAEGGAEIGIGQLGLCGAHSPFGDWTHAPPTQDCLEIVSSCLLARVNGLDRRVVVSARGDSPQLSPLLKVPVEDRYREGHDGTPILSLRGCSQNELADSDPRRDCGWRTRYVGSCAPGRVTFRAPAETMVRVCKGIYGCDHQDWVLDDVTLGNSTYATPAYAGIVGSGLANPGPPGSPTIPVSFDCPARGYFSVMLASRHPRESPPAEDVSVTCGAHYPSSEQEVFTYREGAFFGNLFDSARSPSGPPPTGPEIAGAQYACYSEDWNAGAAYLDDRICALPDPSDRLCFASRPRPCLWQPGSSTRTPAPIHSCSAETCGTQDYYVGCTWAADGSAVLGTTWDHAITVFLNHPCDLSPDPTDCHYAGPFRVPASSGGTTSPSGGSGCLVVGVPLHP